MDLLRTVMLSEILNLIDQTYREYAQVKGYDHHPILRRGFFTEIGAIVQDDPIPDQQMQLDLLEYVRTQAAGGFDILTDDREMIEMMFIDVTNRKRSEPALYKYR